MDSRVDKTDLVYEYGYERATQYFQKNAVTRPRQPFFAYFQMVRPHYSYLADEFMGTFLPIQEGLTTSASQQEYLMKPFSTNRQSIIDNLRLRYDENILKADEQVDRLIETLQQLGLYDQSLIIITADHGTTFNGGYQGNSSPFLFAAEHEIPLLVKYPGEVEGSRVTGLVSNVDIMPTVLDVIGVDYPANYLDGRSLAEAGKDSGRVIYVRLPGDGEHTLAALNGNLKLVQRGADRFLFNLMDDPDERVNLLGQCHVATLQAALDTFEQRISALEAGEPIASLPALISTLSSPFVGNESGICH